MDPARTPTLAEAIEMHLRAMRAKRCSRRSMDTLREECARHLADWLERPLLEVTRNECAVRHEELTDRRGPYLANRVLHHVRAVYNTAARRFAELPPTNPVIAVTFNRVRRRREPIPWRALADWAHTVRRLRNPVRRDLQRFLLFTGLRSLDARSVRWSEVDLEAATLHRPCPKGGEERAFTVPLARSVRELLLGRKAGNVELFGPDCPWAFPTTTRAGHLTHVQEAKEQRLIDGRKRSLLPSPHRLRDTFASAAHEARIHPLDLKVLMNHALPAADDMTQGYIRPSVEHLRGCVEAIEAFLRGKMGEG